MPSEHDQRQVAEAEAVYAPAQFAKFRGRLEGFARTTTQPHRVATYAEDSVTTISLEAYIRDYTDIRERWEARWDRRPHPPKRYFWHEYRTYRADQDWANQEIEKELAWLEAEEREFNDKAWAEEAPDPPPPGYEDDYDLQDWFFDLRHGLEWHRPRR